MASSTPAADAVEKTSIPIWEFDDAYYNNLLASEHVKIVTDPLKGKGLYATKDFAKGDIVLSETALASSQNLDDFNCNRAICGMCMVSLETPRQVLRRVAGKQYVEDMPRPKTFRNRAQAVPCKHADNGCTMVFCSHRCQDTAWKTFHFAGCRGRMNEEQQKAFDEFLTHGWVQDGIDLSDTHFLAFRLLCTALTRHRLHRMPIAQAYAPVKQLIHAPITKFAFTFLLVEDWEKDNIDKAVRSKETAVQKRARRWKHFEEYMADQSKDPITIANLDKEHSKDDMLKLGVGQLRTMLGISPSADPEADALLTEEEWSHLLGAVLLNGQERAPSSAYTEYQRHVKHQPGGDTEMRDFNKKLRAANVDTAALDTSSRGQGVYTIGACFNHSCDPNLQVSYVHENDETLVAHALKDIKAGEEVFISYIEESMTFVERQTQLYEHYLFTCLCSKCNKQKAEGDLGIDAAKKKKTTSADGEEESVEVDDVQVDVDTSEYETEEDQ